MFDIGFQSMSCVVKSNCSKPLGAALQENEGFY